jgi:putative membrane protein
MSVLDLLTPWEPSAPLVLLFIAAGLLYWRGSRRQTVSLARRGAFWSGFVLLYLSLHTRLDYYAEHEFFMHRIQHLILHHLAPLVIMAAYPGMVIRAGLPLRWRFALRRAEHHPAWRRWCAVAMHPTLVSLLFLFSVLIWLVPSIQFISMLDWRLYHLMNWSVTLSGLMYWHMLLDHRPSPPGRMRPGMRVLSPAITMTPQIVVGAIITFTQTDLYPVFSLCGRTYNLAPLVDQSLGGLIMWVPAALLEAIGAMLALRQLMRLSERGRIRSRRRPRAAGPAAAPARGGAELAAIATAQTASGASRPN